MFKRKEIASPKKMDTIIGADTIIEGKIKLEGSLRIDGQVHGEVDCNGDVIIGEKGYVENMVKAQRIVLAGTVKGKIIAREKLHIHSTGRFIGSAEFNAIVIEEGGFYQGESKMNVEDQKVKAFSPKEKQIDNQTA